MLIKQAKINQEKEVLHNEIGNGKENRNKEYN